jgi:hypothetical protein
MKTKLFSILGMCFFLLSTNSLSLMAQQGKSKKHEVFKQKKANKTKKAYSPEAKLATVIHPGKSANYFWDQNTNQWVFNDTSVYAYNPQSWLLSETQRYNTPMSRTVYTYDSKARFTEELYQNWNTMSNSWENNSRTLWVYDANDNRTEIRYETYTTQWDIVYSEKNQYTYDMQGRIAENVYSSWDSNTLQWEISGRETAFIYNGNLLTQYDSQSWNGTSYDNEDRTVLTYSAPSTAPIEAEFKIWNGSTFENDFRYTNLVFSVWCGMFCDETALTSGTIQVWGTPVANQWNTEARTNTTYDLFGGYVQLDENYVNTAWVNSYRYSEFYDNKYNFTGTKGEEWDTTNVAWSTDWEEKEIHTYNPSNQIIETVFQYWDWMNLQLVNNMKKEYFDFQTFTSLAELKNEVGVCVFPNPCSGECHLEINHDQSSGTAAKEFVIYDTQGKQVYAESVSGSKLDFSTKGFLKGIYFYRLNTGERILKSGKLIVE